MCVIALMPSSRQVSPRCSNGVSPPSSHDPPITRDSLVASSRPVDGLRRDMCGRLVILLEDVRVEGEGDHHRRVAEPLGDHLRGDASSKGRGRVGVKEAVNADAWQADPVGGRGGRG